ncbi:MAG: GTP-binding protein [Desulfomonilaceae bacterium]
MKKIPSLFFVGGFLGAGKTTAIRTMAKLLAKRGLKAVAITNDQAAGLVDTLFLENEGIPSQEVAGSCFCCNFQGLADAIKHSSEAHNPDVILAEPVGSCTDIVATIVRPMRSFMKDFVNVSAYSVLIEPKRWIQCAKDGGQAAWSIKFLFHKQVQEADILVVNKSDTISSDQSEKLRSEIQLRYPEIKVLCMSAKDPASVENWLDLAQVSAPGDRWLKEIDYSQYAEAEADMGWLNANVSTKFINPVDGKMVTADVAANIQKEIEERKGEIGHIKLLAIGNTGSIKVGATVNREPMDIEGAFLGPVSDVKLTLNIRASISPGDLAEIVIKAINVLRKSFQATAEVSFLNTFRPGTPNPTYRFTT